jgi:hypothetical protein
MKLRFVFVVAVATPFLIINVSYGQSDANKDELTYSSEKSATMPSLRRLGQILLMELDVDEPIHINQTFTAQRGSEFECESPNRKVQAACRMACGVVQNLGCGCSTTPNGCACECHGID